MSRMQPQAANDNHQSEERTAEVVEAFQRAVDREVGSHATFAEREAAGLRLANELCRADQQAELGRRAERWSHAELDVDGERYRRHSKGTVVYHGLAGPLTVERWLYRLVGEHNGPTIVPMEWDAGLMEGATPALAYAICEGYAQAPSRQVHKTLQTHHREPPSRSTTERLAKTLGAEAAEAVPRLEPAVRAREVVPAQAVALHLGLDRTSAPMEEPSERAPRGRTRPYVRAQPAPVEVCYRMAYVATVSLVDADGYALLTRRYGAPAEQGPTDVVARMMADVSHFYRANPGLNVGIVQDGAPELWRLLRDGLVEHTPVAAWSEAIDRHHLLERLAEALQLAGFTEAWRRQKVAAWNHQLDEDDAAIDEIRKFIRTLKNHRKGESRRKLDAHVVYLDNHVEQMRYRRLRKAGLPVGSGTTEGACKSLIMTRAKRCGQRWHLEGLTAVITLRALEMSERLPPVFDLLARDYTASIRVAA